MAEEENKRKKNEVTSYQPPTNYLETLANLFKANVRNFNKHFSLSNEIEIRSVLDVLRWRMR